MSWYGYKYKLWAVVAGKELPVSQFSCQYALNAIPTASLVLPLGRSMKTFQDSVIHSIDWNEKREIEVYAQLEAVSVLGALDVQPWGRKPVRIFHGDTSGRGAEFMSSASSFVVQCDHWLARMAYTSAISAASVPSNPATLTFNSVLAPLAESRSRAAGGGHMTGLSYADTYVTPTSVGQDFWGKAIKPFFTRLTERESLGDNPTTNSVVGLTAEEIARGNVTARSALDRFEPRDGKYDAGVPLQFKPDQYGGDLSRVAEQISSAVAGDLLESFAGATLWDKLIGYAGHFLFSVVPLVESALVVPVIPGLSETWRIINGDEYGALKFQGGSVRPLRGVGVYGGFGTLAGGGLPASVAVDLDRLSIGGYFQGATSGQVVFKNCPAWMNRLAGTSLPARAVNRPSGSSLFPGLSNAAEVANLAAAEIAGQGRLMNAYAKALYVQEVLKTRALDLTGRLRVDIAPGSMVEVQVDPRKFLSGGDRVVESQHGLVLQVNHSIDAETPHASTSMHVAHLRSASENKKIGYSVARHPLWGSKWSGALLAKIGG